MNINDLFPSNYLKADDLQGHEVECQIESVKLEDLNGERKLVLYFRDRKKGLVLNKTNTQVLGASYGPETDDWFGRKVVVYPDQTPFQGKLVPCLRVRVPVPRAEDGDEPPF